MKVLISSFVSHPNATSEFDVGWNWPVQAAKHHEVWVITQGYHEEAIRRELAARPIPNLHFVFHPVPFAEAAYKLMLKFHPIDYASYLAWQATALKTARKLHAEVNFDVAHHLTWATSRFPSFLPWLDIPYIWGPVGGGEGVPWRLYSTLGMRPALGEIAREASSFVSRLDPFVRKTAKRASRVLITSEQTRRVLPGPAAAQAQVYPSIGIDVAGLEKEAANGGERYEDDNLLQLLFVGRLTSWKGCGLALRALELLTRRGVNARLTVVGDGPEDARMQALAAELGIAERVDFRGRVLRSEVLRLCRTHDAFLFPSLHDSGGIAVLEAMYLGLPVICLNVGGPALSVGDGGIRVECHEVDQIIRDLAEAIESVGCNPKLRQQLTDKAKCRIVEVYDWDKKADYIKELYESTAAR